MVVFDFLEKLFLSTSFFRQLSGTKFPAQKELCAT